MAAATAILIGMAVSAGISAYGSYKAGKAAKKAAYSEAEREEWNAQVADLQADDAIVRGADEESRFRQNVRRLVGTQRASFAGQGVEVNQGSARDVQDDARYLGELDALQIRANAQREAWGFKVEAEDRRRGAEIARRGGNAANTAGKWNAANTVVGGATSMLQSRYGFDRNIQATRAA
jgi:general stress protein YciG